MYIQPKILAICIHNFKQGGSVDSKILFFRWPNNEAEVWFENMRFINLSHNKFRYVSIALSYIHFSQTAGDLNSKQVPSQFWRFLQLEELDMSHNLLGSSYEMGTFNLIYFGLKLKKVSVLRKLNFANLISEN